MKITLIIPIYNEKDIISQAIDTFSAFLRDSFEDWELIFVSDGSTDGCDSVVAKASESDGRIRLCSYTDNAGKGYAVRTGVAAATGDVIIYTDCDDAYGTDAVLRLARTFSESPDADIVIGSRSICKDGYEGYTFMRKAASKIYIKVINLVSGFKVSDSQCGLKGFRAEAAKKIFRNCRINRWAFDLEVLMLATRLGFKIKELPVKVINHRQSKIHVASDSIKMLADISKLKKEVNSRELV